MVLEHRRPLQGCAAEGSAADVVGVGTTVGVPVSTPNVITCCILGVGSTRRLSAVRWGVDGGIVYAWVLALP